MLTKGQKMIEKVGYYESNEGFIYYYNGENKTPIHNLLQEETHIKVGFFIDGYSIAQNGEKIIKFLSQDERPELYL